MNKPKFLRFRGRTVISATAIPMADGKFMPNAVIQTNGVDSTVNELVSFDGPLFDSYFDAAQYALEATDEMHVQLRRARHAPIAEKSEQN